MVVHDSYTIPTGGIQSQRGTIGVAQANLLNRVRIDNWSNAVVTKKNGQCICSSATIETITGCERCVCCVKCVIASGARG